VAGVPAEREDTKQAVLVHRFDSVEEERVTLLNDQRWTRQHVTRKGTEFDMIHYSPEMVWGPRRLDVNYDRELDLHLLVG